MRLVDGVDMFEEEAGVADLLYVTTNAVLDRHGRLVMGRGAARRAAELWPELPALFGEMLRTLFGPGRDYGLLTLPEDCRPAGAPLGHTRLGAFQTKRDWRDPSDLGLIRQSAQLLVGVARLRPEWRIAVNFPGRGHGRLDEAVVAPLLESWPDNIFVYRLG